MDTDKDVDAETDVNANEQLLRSIRRWCIFIAFCLVQITLILVTTILLGPTPIALLVAFAPVVALLIGYMVYSTAPEE